MRPVSDLTDLTPDDCPLLVGEPAAAELIGQYNDLAGRLRALRDADPEFFASRDVQVVVDKLLGVKRDEQVTVDSSGKLIGGTPKLPLRAMFTRPRYSVGFLGLSNAGKSTTLNRVLGYTEKHPDEEKPAHEGGNFRPTTSLATRIHAPLRNETVTKPRFILRYMTRPEYQVKRDGLSRALGLDPSEGDAALKQAVQSELQQAEAAQLKDRIANLRSLQELISAAEKYGGYLHDGPPAREDHTVAYEARRTILTHAPGQNSSIPIALLSEADLTLPTTAVEPELELVDMPGIGVAMLRDSLVTTYLLPQLDGVLVFIAASAAMTDKNLVDCIQDITNRFKSQLESRLWLIFTKCDTLNNNYVRPGEESCLAGIKSVLQDRMVPLQQVGFLAGPWQGLTPEQVSQRFEQNTGTTDPLGRMQVQPDSPLGSAFQELWNDGGLARLKQLIGSTVRRDVAQKTRGELEDRLNDARRALDLAEKLRSDAADPLREEQLEAVYQGVRRLMLFLQGRRDVYADGEPVPDVSEGPGLKLTADLTKAFDAVCKDTPMQWTKDLREVAVDFPRHAQRLEASLRQSLSLTIIRDVYEQIGHELQALPPVQVVAYPQGVASAWESLTSTDREDQTWRTGLLPTFRDDQLFRSPPDHVHGALTGKTYREMMLQKIKATVHQAMHGLRRRACKHLREISAAYAPATAAAAPPAGS